MADFKTGFNSAFLQTGADKHDVYVVLPRECRRKLFYWLLLTSDYGFVNASEKWLEQCYLLFLNMGLCQSHFLPQLLYAVKESDLEIVAIKIFDYILITGKRSRIQNLISSIKLRYKHGTVVFGPGSFLFYRFQIFQDTYMTIWIDGDGRVESLNNFPIDRHRRKQVSEFLTHVELKSFR